MGSELSPSGRYRLAVVSDGTWRSTGVITRESDGTEIAVVNRNYCAFPALWIEGHASGHDYLLCGSDYQGHTVIELDTGKRRDTLMEGTDTGHGFCMADARYDTSWKVVIVSGCIWACPYEYRLYDYSDPLAAGPQLEMVPRPGHEEEDDAWAEDDPHWPEIKGDLVRFFQSPRAGTDDDSEDEENRARAASPPAAVKIFRREGNKLLFVSEEVSANEQKIRTDRDAGRARFEAKIKAFKEADPLYAVYKEQLADPIFVPESYESYGVTHDSWCIEWKGDETRWCRRIQTVDRCIIELEWAIETGPIKVIVHVDHKSVGDKFFPHSTAGMEEAFAYAKSCILESRR